jgi:predicted dehydrogenase
MEKINRRQLLKQSSALALSAPLVNWFAATQASANSVERIKIGQIGTTHAHAAGKLETMRKFSDMFEVVGVVETDPQRRAQLQESPIYRDVKWLTEEELLGIKDLQAVAVETAVRDLVPTAARCIAAGKHVHLDKPAGESLSDFQTLMLDATRRKRTVQMGYMFRYNPAFVFLFNAIKQGWLGTIFEAHGVMSKTVGADSRRQLAEYPGGAMFELGCHLIDALLVALGPPANVTAFVRRTRANEGDLLADNQLAVFEYPLATATIRSTLLEVDGGRRRQFIVCGDRGTIEIKPLEAPVLTLTLDRDQGEFKQGTQQVELPKAGGRYDGDFLDLAKIIRGEKHSEFSIEHDLRVQESILRASGLGVE